MRTAGGSPRSDERRAMDGAAGAIHHGRLRFAMLCGRSQLPWKVAIRHADQAEQSRSRKKRDTQDHIASQCASAAFGFACPDLSVHFSCLPKRNEPKRRAPRLRARLAGARRVRAWQADFSTAHPCAGEKASASCTRPCGSGRPPGTAPEGAPGRVVRSMQRGGCDAFWWVLCEVVG